MWDVKGKAKKNTAPGGRERKKDSVGLDKCIFDRFYREISFPHDEFQMAKITFSVELSADPKIRWEETWQGLLRFFAMTAYDTSLDLEKFLKDKILHSSSPDSDFKGTDRENPTG